MDVYKRISIATLIIVSLAIADGVGDDSEIRHFDAQSAFDSASDAELQFINDIKLMTNNNWDELTKVPQQNYRVIKNEIDLDFDLIINSEFQIEETSKMISSEPSTYGLVGDPINDYNDIYHDDQISATEYIGSGLKFSGYSDLADFGTVFEFDSDIYTLKYDISSKLNQIAIL